ncbi:unnamed protein product [Rotaria socialis]|uniref:Uncharacterized protein n=1 Tax=Rotaria socialis TaxID=392032 RepID=A0A817Q1J1_9BILA|nr:unnamed protein product [Rotaria socialis]CAF3327080.1 unnamed protein product [Rotaria socialis]CAF3649992.1 unnamed protein product [Rotaria socialis]CAF4391060.1 unnamed protein product [Rotaria socialis]
MCERHSSIHSHVKDDGDEKLLRLITTHEQQQESVSINTVNEASETLDSTDKKESETEPLLDEIMVCWKNVERKNVENRKSEEKTSKGKMSKGKMPKGKMSKRTY